MITRLFEATNGFNWGKFMVGRWDTEWAVRSVVSPIESMGLLRQSGGWDHEAIVVFDLQTGEGAKFRPGGFAHADLSKHRIWVCPMFEPFLEWLYRQDLSDLDALPQLVELPDAPSAFAGYRREGES